MTSTSFQAPEISTEIRIFADWEQSSSAIWWQGLDEDPEDKTTWHHTPYQVADAGHNQEEACASWPTWQKSCDCAASSRFSHSRSVRSRKKYSRMEASKKWRSSAMPASSRPCSCSVLAP